MATAAMTTAAAAMYQRFRLLGAAAPGDEAGLEIGEIGCTTGAEGATADAPDETGVIAGSAAALTDALFPESISRFSRFKSARISDATW
jgi:hypothetical protein